MTDTGPEQLRTAIEAVLRQRSRGGQGWGSHADMHEEDVTAAILRDPAVRAALASSASTVPEGLVEALAGLVAAVIAMKKAIPPATVLGEDWRPFLKITGDVNSWLDASEVALRAALPDQPVAAPDREERT